MISIKQLATSILISITMVSAAPASAEEERYRTPEEMEVQAEMLEKHKDIPHAKLIDLATGVSTISRMVDIGYWPEEDARQCLSNDAEQHGYTELLAIHDELAYLPAYVWLVESIYAHTKKEYPDKDAVVAKFGEWKEGDCG